MKKIYKKLTKGQRRSIIVLFLPAAFFSLVAMDLYEEMAVVFFSYVIFIIWGYLILALTRRKFFEKHLGKISHAMVVLLVCLNILTLGELNIESQSHWEPEKPAILIKEKISDWEVSYMEFCTSDFATLRYESIKEKKTIFTFDSGKIVISDKDTYDARNYSDKKCYTTPNMYKNLYEEYLGEKITSQKGFTYLSGSLRDTKKAQVYIKQLEVLTAIYNWKNERKEIKDFPDIQLEKNPFDEDYSFLWLFTIFLIGVTYFNLYSEKKFL